MSSGRLGLDLSLRPGSAGPSQLLGTSDWLALPSQQVQQAWMPLQYGGSSLQDDWIPLAGSSKPYATQPQRQQQPMQQGYGQQMQASVPGAGGSLAWARPRDPSAQRTPSPSRLFSQSAQPQRQGSSPPGGYFSSQSPPQNNTTPSRWH